MLDSSILPVTYITNIFSQSVDLLFHFINEVFYEQEFLIWIKFNLSVFLLWLICFFLSQKSLHILKSHKYYPIFSFRNFIIIALMFRSIFQLKLTFVYYVKWRLRFTFLMQVSSYFNIICWKYFSFFKMS